MGQSFQLRKQVISLEILIQKMMKTTITFKKSSKNLRTSRIFSRSVFFSNISFQTVYLAFTALNVNIIATCSVDGIVVTKLQEPVHMVVTLDTQAPTATSVRNKTTFVISTLCSCMNFYPCFVACPRGTFGQNCRKTCGNCLQNTTCNHENGTCPNGCNIGFKGQYCSTCKFENT